MSFHDTPIFRISVPGPGGGPPRQRCNDPHPSTTVALVKHLIETTRLPHAIVAERAGIDKGTVSRWTAKHGRTRPPGARKRSDVARPR